MLAWLGDVAQFPDRVSSSSVKCHVAQGSHGSHQLHTAQCRVNYTSKGHCGEMSMCLFARYLRYSWKAQALKQRESSWEDSEKL